MIKYSVLAFFLFISALAAYSSGAESLDDTELNELFSNTTIKYDYGSFETFAFTQSNGTNYFDMNGYQSEFDERKPIIKTDIVIADQKVCFRKGWVVCWTMQKTSTPGHYTGLDADTGEFNANVYLIGSGDIQNIKQRYR